MPVLAPSQVCAEMTKRREGCRLVAYKDLAGFWTYGWGCLMPHQEDALCEGVTITQEFADQLFALRLGEAGEVVGRLVTVPLQQGQFDALTDFVYCFGEEKFGSSTLLKLLNQMQYRSAADQLVLWDRAGGREIKGLEDRRIEERTLFLSDTLS
jgi:lysozyme